MGEDLVGLYGYAGWEGKQEIMEVLADGNFTIFLCLTKEKSHEFPRKDVFNLVRNVKDLRENKDS